MRILACTTGVARETCRLAVKETLGLGIEVSNMGDEDDNRAICVPTMRDLR